MYRNGADIRDANTRCRRDSETPASRTIGRRKVGSFHERTRESSSRGYGRTTMTTSLRYSFTSSPEMEREAEGASGERSDQRSPESVLYEPQHLEYRDELSPEIAPKFPRIESNGLAERVAGRDDGTMAARRIQRPYPSSSTRTSDTAPSNPPTRDSKRNVRSTNDLLDPLEHFNFNFNRELTTKSMIVDDPLDTTDYRDSSLNSELNGDVSKTTDGTYRGRSSAAVALGRRKLFRSTTTAMTCDAPRRSAASRSATFFRLGSEPLSGRNDARIFAEEEEEVTHHNEEKRRINERYETKPVDDHYVLLDKTLSMNDDLAREISSYMDVGQSPTTPIAGRTTALKTISPVATTYGALQHIARPEFADNVRSSLDEFGPPGSVDGRGTRRMRDERKKRRKRSPTWSRDRSIDRSLAAKRIGERLLANWREFQRIFAYLRWVDRKIFLHGEDTSVSSRYEKFTRDNRTFVSPSFSPKTSCATNRGSGSTVTTTTTTTMADRDATRLLLAKKRTRDPLDVGSPPAVGSRKTESKIPRGLIVTPRRSTSSSSSSSSSPAAAKRCRTILRFEDEDEEERATGKDSSILLTEEKRNSEKRGFACPWYLSACAKSHRCWKNDVSSESTPTRSVDLAAVPDRDRRSSDSLQEVTLFILFASFPLIEIVFSIKGNDITGRGSGGDPLTNKSRLFCIFFV